MFVANTRYICQTYIQKAYWSFARLSHPDKGGDPSVFTETQQYFELALQEFDEHMQDCEGEYSDEDAPHVVWDVDAADFIAEDASTGQQIHVDAPQPLASSLHKARALMLEDIACLTTQNTAERDEVADTNAPFPQIMNTITSTLLRFVYTHQSCLKNKFLKRSFALQNTPPFPMQMLPFQLQQKMEAQTWTQLFMQTNAISRANLSH